MTTSESTTGHRPTGDRPTSEGRGAIETAVGDLYAECADRLGGIAYLVTGHPRVAARVVESAFANAGLRSGRVAAWPASPESWVRSEVLRLAGRPLVRMRLLSLPVPADPRDVGIVLALADLPPHQRAALVLHHVAGLGPADVALETEATIGATVARITNAEAALAGVAAAADLGRLLRGAARRAGTPRAAPARVAALPRRRSARAAAFAGAGVLGLVLSPSVAGPLGGNGGRDIALAGADLGGDALPTSLGRASLGEEERTRQEARVRAFEARGRGVLAEAGRPLWTPLQGPTDFLPHRRQAPRVQRPESPGRAKGRIEQAFVHDGRLFVAVERKVKDGDAAERKVFRVRDRATVEPGSDLRAAVTRQSVALPAQEKPSMPLAQYLWLVQQGSDTELAPMVLHYDKRGRITRISEAPEP